MPDSHSIDNEAKRASQVSFLCYVHGITSLFVKLLRQIFQFLHHVI